MERSQSTQASIVFIKWIFKWTLGGLGLGALFIALLNFSQVMGHRIPSPNVTQDYATGAMLAFTLLTILAFVPFEGLSKRIVLVQWLVRLLVTLVFMLYYESHYGLDSFYYFDIGTNSDPATYQLDFYSGTNTIKWFTSLISYYVPYLGSFHALKVMCSFLGLLGAYLFYRAYSLYVGQNQYQLLILCGFFPSVLFWSSIYGKDPFTFFAIGLIVYGSVGILKKFSLPCLLALAAGTLVIALIRVWNVALFLVPFALIYFIHSRANAFTKLILGLSLLTLAGAVGQFIMGKLHVHSLQDFIEVAHVISRGWSRGGSAQEVPVIHSVADLLQFLPLGMGTVLIRPLPGEVNNLFGILAGMENLFLLGFLGYSLTSWRRSFFKDPFIQYIFLTLLIWSSFYGLISFQNLGTAVRFKLQVLPLILMFCFYVQHKAKDESSVTSDQSAKESIS